MTIWDEEAERARLYRANWRARINYRHSQIRRLEGSPAALVALWENYRVIWDPTNYVDHTDDGTFLTPYDIDDNGATSASPVNLPNTRHASTQNDRPHGG